jgi:hypothetical protein
MNWSNYWPVNRSSQQLGNGPSPDLGPQSVCSVSYGFSRRYGLGYNIGLEFIIERTLK